MVQLDLAGPAVIVYNRELNPVYDDERACLNVVLDSDTDPTCRLDDCAHVLLAATGDYYCAAGHVQRRGRPSKGASDALHLYRAKTAGYLSRRR